MIVRSYRLRLPHPSEKANTKTSVVTCVLSLVFIAVDGAGAIERECPAKFPCAVLMGSLPTSESMHGAGLHLWDIQLVTWLVSDFEPYLIVSTLISPTTPVKARMHLESDWAFNLPVERRELYCVHDRDGLHQTLHPPPLPEAPGPRHGSALGCLRPHRLCCNVYHCNDAVSTFWLLSYRQTLPLIIARDMYQSHSTLICSVRAQYHIGCADYADPGAYGVASANEDKVQARGGRDIRDGYSVRISLYFSTGYLSPWPFPLSIP